MLEKMQAPPPPRETATTNPRQHVPLRVCPMIIPIKGVTSKAGTTMAKEHYYLTNWKKCNGPNISTRQFCLNLMENPV